MSRPYKIENASYDDDGEEPYEARTVADCRSKCKYYRQPIDNIVCQKDEPVSAL